MGRFCTECGRPLQEGEICSCQLEKEEQKEEFENQQVPPQQQKQSQQNPSQQQVEGHQIPPQQPMWEQAPSPKSTAIQEFFQKVVGCFFHLIKKPVSTGRDMLVEADIKISFMFIVVQGIFSAFFALAVAKRCSTYIFALARILDDRIRNRITFTELWAIPYNRIFIVTVLVSIILSCILALLLLIGHLISKCMVSYRQMLSAVAIRSAVLVPAILASLILFELHSGIGIFMFFTVNIWGFVTMLLTMSSFIPDYKKNIFAFMISGVIIVFILVTIFIVSKMWTFYLPDVIRATMDNIERSGNHAGDLLRDLLMNFY